MFEYQVQCFDERLNKWTLAHGPGMSVKPTYTDLNRAVKLLNAIPQKWAEHIELLKRSGLEAESTVKAMPKRYRIAIREVSDWNEWEITREDIDRLNRTNQFGFYINRQIRVNGVTISVDNALKR